MYLFKKAKIVNTGYFGTYWMVGHSNIYTVKPVYNRHPWDPKIEAVVDRWSLFRGGLYYKH